MNETFTLEIRQHIKEIGLPRRTRPGLAFDLNQPLLFFERVLTPSSSSSSPAAAPASAPRTSLPDRTQLYSKLN
jgi:hypothetical protein